MWNADDSAAAAFSRCSSYRETREDDEEALRWAALQRLPTFERLRRGFLADDDGEVAEVDVSALGPADRVAVIERLIKDASDAEEFFRRIRRRFDAKLKVRLISTQERYAGRTTVRAYNQFSHLKARPCVATETLWMSTRVACAPLQACEDLMLQVQLSR